MKTYVAIGDVHGEDKYIDMIMPFLKDFQPNELVIAGDLNDFQIISDYDRHQRRRKGTEATWLEIDEEINWAKRLLDKFNNIMPKTKKTYIKGNHDIRYDKFAQYEQCQKNEKDQWVQNVLELKKKKYNFIDIGGFYKIGKCYFMHGEKFGGDNFAKGAAMKLRKNVRLWHHHTNQSFTITSPLDAKDIVEVKAVGCLCDKDPQYLKGLTNRWINSFLVGYVMPNGEFFDFVVNIIDGKFVINGKLYK